MAVSLRQMEREATSNGEQSGPSVSSLSPKGQCASLARLGLPGPLLPAIAFVVVSAADIARDIGECALPVG